LATLREEHAAQLAVTEGKALRDAQDLFAERERKHESALKSINESHALQLAEVEARSMQKLEASLAERDHLHELIISKLKEDNAAQFAEVETRSLQGRENSATELEREHESALAALKQEHASRIADLERNAAQQAEELRREHEQDHAAALATLAQEHKMQLGEIARAYQDQAQSELRERDSAHEAAMEKVIQDYTARIADTEQSIAMRSLALGQSHEQTLTELNEQHAAQLASIEGLARDAVETNLRDRDQEHKDFVQELVRTHESQLAELEQMFAEREKHAHSSLVQAHEGALAQLRISHAAEISRLQGSIAQEIEAARLEHSKGQRSDTIDSDGINQLSSQDRSVNLAASAGSHTRSPAQTSEAPSRGLSHIFVNHEPDNAASAEPPSQPQASLDEDPVDASIDEIPIAYIEDEQSAPKPPANDSSDHAVLQQLQSDNALLRIALNNAQEEIASLKSQPTTATDTRTRIQTSRSLDDDNDTFPSPFTQAAADNGLTLEGTLHRLQMQAAQLLEINDDLMAEQERWRSIRSTGSDRSKPAYVVPPSAS
jgi:hypothetical protein